MSRAYSISPSSMITTYSLKLSCVTLYLTKPMTWSWGGSEVVLMTLIFNSQQSISGEPIGPDKTNQINIKAQNLMCTSFYSKRFRTPTITEFELEAFSKMWILVVFLLTIGPSLLHSSVLMRNQTNLNARPRVFCTNKCKLPTIKSAYCYVIQ